MQWREGVFGEMFFVGSMKRVIEDDVLKRFVESYGVSLLKATKKVLELWYISKMIRSLGIRSGILCG